MCTIHLPVSRKIFSFAYTVHRIFTKNKKVYDNRLCFGYKEELPPLPPPTTQYHHCHHHSTPVAHTCTHVHVQQNYVNSCSISWQSSRSFSHSTHNLQALRKLVYICARMDNRQWRRLHKLTQDHVQAYVHMQAYRHCTLTGMINRKQTVWSSFSKCKQQTES